MCESLLFSSDHDLRLMELVEMIRNRPTHKPYVCQRNYIGNALIQKQEELGIIKQAMKLEQRFEKKKKTKTCMDKEYKIRALLKLEMPKQRSKIQDI